MPIEVPAAEVYALAATLRAAGDGAAEVGARLAAAPAFGGPLQGAVTAFLDAHRAAAAALAGELHWLAGTVTAVADSWLRLDGSLLPARGEAARR